MTLDDTGENPLVLETDGLRYELDRPPAKNGKKIVVSVLLASGSDGAPLVDRTDLYTFRSRERLATLVAETFGKTPGVVLGHLALLLDQIERATGAAKKPERVVLTSARKAAAEKLLRSKDVLDRAASAVEALGLVGEARNRRLAYLVATSRLLAKPCSAILRAPPATGKSELIERTAQLMPEESVDFLSRLTPQALFYLGPDALRNKLVLVDETAGATGADYPIRTLQSRGLLTLAAVVKGRTQPFTVHGPIALMSGTTSDTINPENLSRCLELMLDDSPEQTKRIHEAQRRTWSGEAPPCVDTGLWQDAQRVLEPLEVTIPFASRLRFPVRTTKDRRDHAKLLSLIATHALLHQLRRDRDGTGRLVATVGEDYRAVFGLFWPLVEAELEDLSPRAAALYRALAKRETRTAVSRRDAAALMGWTYTTTRRTLDELHAHELLKLAEGGTPKKYELAGDVTATAGLTLTHPDEIE